MNISTETLYWLNLFNTYGWFSLILIAEFIWPTRHVNFLKKGMVSDIIHTYEPFLKAYTISQMVILLSPHIQNGLLQGVLTGKPLWIVLLSLIFVSEVTFYFVHRLTHMNNFLWEFHKVHHSSTIYYSLMTSRFHIIDILIFNIPFIIAISYLKADEYAMTIFITFQSFMDRYGHSNINGPRFTGYFITSPHFHAWHHSNELASRNKNFSRDFVFMDYLFGTAYYPKDKSPTSFGIPNYSNNFFMHQVQPFITIIKRLISKPLKHLKINNGNL